MKQAMPFTVYCLLGSYLVLNTVNVYSLPIDDGAVSCFSFHLDCSFSLWLKHVNELRNESNNSMEKGGELRDWINWTTISDFLFFQPTPIQPSQRLRIIHFWCFVFFSFSLLFISQIIVAKEEIRSRFFSLAKGCKLELCYDLIKKIRNNEVCLECFKEFCEF